MKTFNYFQIQENLSKNLEKLDNLYKKVDELEKR